MTGRQILENVFEVSFQKGNYLHQLEKLDALGMITKRKMIEILCYICEELDQFNDTYQTKRNTDKPLQSGN